MKSNWDNLRYFNALAQFSTLSAAARELGVSHSTVQRHIATLENELNVSLFHHTATGYVLTEAGDKLYSETSDIQSTLKILSSKISTGDSALNGTVSITVTDTLGYFILPELMAKSRERYPGIELALSIENRISDIRQFEADIAIRSAVSPPQELIGRKVASLAFGLFASSDYLQQHRLSVETAATEAPDFIQLYPGNTGSVFQDWLPAARRRAGNIRINGFFGAYRLCSAGLGLALLPAYIARYDPQLIELECGNPPQKNGLWLLSPPELRDTARVRTIRQLLYEELNLIFNQAGTESAAP